MKDIGFGEHENWINSKDQKSTLESLVNPSFILGTIIMCAGASGFMSLKARTCQKNDKYWWIDNTN